MKSSRTQASGIKSASRKDTMMHKQVQMTHWLSWERKSKSSFENYKKRMTSWRLSWSKKIKWLQSWHMQTKIYNSSSAILQIKKSYTIVQLRKSSRVLQASKGCRLLQKSKGSNLLQKSKNNIVLQAKKFPREAILKLS